MIPHYVLAALVDAAQQVQPCSWHHQPPSTLAAPQVGLCTHPPTHHQPTSTLTAPRQHPQTCALSSSACVAPAWSRASRSLILASSTSLSSERFSSRSCLRTQQDAARADGRAAGQREYVALPRQACCALHTLLAARGDWAGCGCSSTGRTSASHAPYKNPPSHLALLSAQHPNRATPHIADHVLHSAQWPLPALRSRLHALLLRLRQLSCSLTAPPALA